MVFQVVSLWADVLVADGSGLKEEDQNLSETEVVRKPVQEGGS